MEINNLNQRQFVDQHTPLFRLYAQLDNLLGELRKRDLPDSIVAAINSDIDLVNLTSYSELQKQTKKSQTAILWLLEKELKLVTRNHYRSTWMSMGLAVFGVPIGLILGLLIANMGMLGVGLPFGLLIGMVVGAAMDKRASEEDRQLDVEIKY
jgi:hypothetical protein